MPATDEMLRAAPRISQSSIDKLYTVRQQALDDRAVIEPMLKQIARFFNPSLANWDDDGDVDAPMDRKEIYSNVGEKASARLADCIQGYGFSRSNPWARVQLEDEDLMKRDDVADWLQKEETHLYRQWARSNFYDEGRPFARQFSDFGTATMFRHNNVARGVSSYQTLHIKNYVILDNWCGEVDSLFRDFWLSAFDAAAKFKDVGGIKVLPRTIQDAYQNNNLRKWKFTQFILPLDKFDLDLSMRETRGMPIYSLYMADCDRKSPIREGGYLLRPFFTARFSRGADGSPWGCDAPGFLELSNQRQVNGLMKVYHRIAQRNGMPPFKATEGMEGLIDLSPDAITYVSPGNDFKQAASGGDPGTIMQDIASISGSIDESYHADLFLTLSRNLDRIKTATLAQGIQGEQSVMATNFFGRLSTEFLEPFVEDSFQTEMDTGRSPPPPQVLKGRAWKVVMVSPLSLLQKRYLLLDNTRQALTEILQVAAIAPEVKDKYDWDAYADSISDMYHIDRRIVRDMIAVERIRQGRAKERAMIISQQLGNERAKAQATAYGAAAKAPEEGSPAAQAMDQGAQGAQGALGG